MGSEKIENEHLQIRNREKASVPGRHTGPGQGRQLERDPQHLQREIGEGWLRTLGGHRYRYIAQPMGKGVRDQSTGVKTVGGGGVRRTR